MELNLPMLACGINVLGFGQSSSATGIFSSFWGLPDVGWCHVCAAW